MKTFPFLLITVSALIFSSTACKKRTIENQCCTTEYEITTQNYSRPQEFELYIPQAFSPNRDGRNEQFYPIGVGWDLDQLVIKKGLRTVYESTNRLDAFWDGGSEDDGRYKYEMRFETTTGDHFDVEGEVCLFRFGAEGNDIAELEREVVCDCVTLDMLDSLQGPIYEGRDCPANGRL